jgi:DNA-binding beta-propeller fold protein YncE
MTASQVLTQPGAQEGPDDPSASGEPSAPVAGGGGRRASRKKVALLLLLLAGMALLLGLAIWYLLFRQPIPLPIPQVPGQANMPAYHTSIYGVTRPLGTAVTSDGSRIYVTESGGERISRILDAGGAQIAKLEPPVSTGNLHTPVYVAIDPVAGDVYVTDRATASIYVYDAAGTFKQTYEPPAELKGWQPLGIAFDAAGNLYVTDVSVVPQTVVVLDRQGKLLRTLGADQGMSFPNGLAVDKNGYVYVADSNNGRLVVFDSSGAEATRVGRGVGEGSLGMPRGVAVSDDGRVYVADATGQMIYVYRTFQPGTPGLELLGSFGDEGIGDGQFQFPNGLALDGRGRVYIADSANQRVQIWSY